VRAPLCRQDRVALKPETWADSSPVRALKPLPQVVPRTRDLLSGNKVPLPALTVWVMGAGRLAVRWGWVPVAGALAAVLALRRRLRDDETLRVRVARRWFSVPVLGRGYTLLVSQRFARTLAILLRGGVPLIDGFVLAGRATGNAWLARRAGKEAEAIRHGDKLSEAVARMEPLSGVLPGWIRIGESGGGLEDLLDSAGLRFQQQSSRFISLLLSFLEPLLILLIGGFVLVITLAVLLPIFRISRGL
jgi:type II secretory pathway component PulF